MHVCVAMVNWTERLVCNSASADLNLATKQVLCVFIMGVESRELRAEEDPGADQRNFRMTFFSFTHSLFEDIQEDCRDSSLGPIHFDTRVDKWISVLQSFETPACIIYKCSTFVFNKVVR